MDGYDNLIETLEYFEQRLSSQEPITTVKELSRQSGYCSHHLSNLFTAHTDLKLKEYLQARLLTAIFTHAYRSNIPLSNLALLYGFHDYETFYRACRKRLRETPSRILQNGLKTHGLQERVYPQRTKEPAKVAGAIVQLPSCTLCGLNYFIWPETRSFHRQWKQFELYRSAVKAPVHETVSFQFSAWKEGEDQAMRILCGVEVDPSPPQEAIFTCQEIPQTTCIRFLHTQEVSQIKNTYQYIYGTYFAQSTYQCLGNWELQRYKANTTTIEIYIPIKT